MSSLKDPSLKHQTAMSNLKKLATMIPSSIPRNKPEPIIAPSFVPKKASVPISKHLSDINSTSIKNTSGGNVTIDMKTPKNKSNVLKRSIPNPITNPDGIMSSRVKPTAPPSGIQKQEIPVPFNKTLVGSSGIEKQEKMVAPTTKSNTWRNIALGAAGAVAGTAIGLGAIGTVISQSKHKSAEAAKNIHHELKRISTRSQAEDDENLKRTESLMEEFKRRQMEED
jgi:hypothetical protein